MVRWGSGGRERGFSVMGERGYYELGECKPVDAFIQEKKRKKKNTQRLLRNDILDTLRRNTLRNDDKISTHPPFFNRTSTGLRTGLFCLPSSGQPTALVLYSGYFAVGASGHGGPPGMKGGIA